MNDIDFNKVNTVTFNGKKYENVEMVFLGCDIEEGINITFIDKRDIDYKFNTENLTTSDFEDCIEVVYDKENCRTYSISPDRKNGFAVICKFIGISDEERDAIEDECEWIVQKKANVVFNFIKELYDLPKMVVHKAVIEDDWIICDIIPNESSIDEGSVDAGFCGIDVDDGNLLLQFTEHDTGIIYHFDLNDIRSFEGAVKEFTDLLDDVDDPDAPPESKAQIMDVLYGDIDQRREVFCRIATNLTECIPHQVHGSYGCEGELLLYCHGH